MAMLHTVNKSPFECNSLDSCLNHAKEGSSVLLIEDGIYGVINGSAVTGKIKAASGKVTFYALGPDIKARGISDDHIIDGVTVVDYGGFVDLVTKHDNVQSWL
jgi:tRNA 2-thiouridine synthesizing protein B